MAAVALNTVDGPWVAAGDWNMTPKTLAASGWLKVVGGVIFATRWQLAARARTISLWCTSLFLTLSSASEDSTMGDSTRITLLAC